MVFERAIAHSLGRRIRQICFERRSRLPVSAACVVANGLREILSQLLSKPVSVTLCEPIIPAAEAWGSITRGAALFRAHGQLSDGAFILRRKDASALIAAIFSEESLSESRGLSAIEDDVLARTMVAFGKALDLVCGLRDGSAPERCAELSDYTTYFEVVFESPFQASLGIALSRDPVERTSRTLAFSDLLDVEIEVAAQFCRGSMTSDALLRLEPGTLVPTDTKVGSLSFLTAGGAAVAQGDCGSIEQRNAFIVSKAPKAEH